MPKKFIVSKKELEKYFRTLGEYDFVRDFVTLRRNSGRSTALAFGYLKQAIDSPGVPIALKDHYRHADSPHKSDVEGSRYMLSLICHIISALKLSGFTSGYLTGEGNSDFGVTEYYCITFTPYEIDPRDLIKN